MYMLILVLLIIGALVVHELGHAFSMKRYGVHIAELGIGLPYSPRLIIRSRFIDHWLGHQTAVSLSPWLLGAYVKTRRVRYQDILTYREQSHIYGAGIVANIMFGCLLLAILYTIRFVQSGWQGPPFWIALASVLVGHFVYQKQRQLTAWIFPVLSLGVLAWIRYQYWEAVPKGQVTEVLGGPIAIAGIVKLADSFTRALWIGAILSFSFAGLNLLPLTGLDGGHLWDAILRRIAPRLAGPVQTLGIFASLGLLILIFTGDIIRLFR